MIRPEHFYGGALNYEVNADLEIFAIARVLTLDTASGSWNVTIPGSELCELFRRMDFGYFGGPALFILNTGVGEVTITLNIGGKQVTYNTIQAGDRAIVVIGSNINELAGDQEITGHDLLTPETQKPTSVSTGKILQDTDGFVHNGGPSGSGGTGCEINDLPTGTWSAGTASTNRHGDSAGWGMRQGIHLVGSNSNVDVDRTRHSRYRSAAWSTRTDFPRQIEGGNGGSLKSIGYVFEGHARDALGDRPNGLRSYDDQADAYSVKADQPHPADSGGCASLEAHERIMLVRGLPLQQASWLYHGPSGTYESVDFYTGTAKRSMSAFERVGQVYSVGGYDDNGAAWFDTTDVFDVPSRAWSVGATIPAQRSKGAAFAWHEVGIYAGGEDNGSSATQTVYRMNASSSWFATTNKGSTNQNTTQHGAEIAV